MQPMFPCASLLHVHAFRRSFGSVTFCTMERLKCLILACGFYTAVRSKIYEKEKETEEKRLKQWLSTRTKCFNERVTASMSWLSRCCLLFISLSAGRRTMKISSLVSRHFMSTVAMFVFRSVLDSELFRFGLLKLWIRFSFQWTALTSVSITVQFCYIPCPHFCINNLFFN